MFLKEGSDPYDPIVSACKNIRRTFRNLLLIVVATVVMAVAWGVPSVQWTYTAASIPATTAEKHEADYLNVFGWHHVQSGQYRREKGCPFLLFIPVRDCMDLAPYKNPMTTYLTPSGFFNE